MKTIRWMFYFEEGSVKSETLSEEEDGRIRRFVKKDPKGTLHLPNKEAEIWVNFDRVKCFTRQLVDLEEERKAHQAAQEQKASA